MLGSDPLNINEARAVLRLLRYICSHKDPELLSLLKRARAANQILVLAADSRLVPASDCVHTATCPPHLLSRRSFSPCISSARPCRSLCSHFNMIWCLMAHCRVSRKTARSTCSSQLESRCSAA